MSIGYMALSGKSYLSMCTTKSTKWPVRPAKTDQPGHPPSLISLPYAPNWWVAKDPVLLRAESEDWSDWADAQGDLSSLAHMSFCWFCHVAAHLVLPFGYTERQKKRPQDKCHNFSKVKGYYVFILSIYFQYLSYSDIMSTWVHQ